MCCIQLLWFFKNKKGKLSSADTLYASIMVLILVWIFLDVFNLYKTSLGLANFFIVITIFITTLIAIVGDLFALSLKRDVKIIDIIIMFPILLITTFYILEGGWFSIVLNGENFYHFLSTGTFYWLASILMVILLNLNLLYRLSDWFKGTWAYRRVFGLIVAESVGITLVILANVFLYPWFISARLGSFFLALAFFINFWVDQKIMRKKIVCEVGRGEKKDALKRICEFL
ncbi:MAG: hypothetical protein GON13_02210 [Nanoarchaeota archaeon]|nr:hypothetical protein [Nanoarchaeota archaeon]